MVPLNFKHTIFDRSAGAAHAFKIGVEIVKRFLIQPQTLDQGDGLTFACLGITEYPDDPVTSRGGRGFLANAGIHRSAAFGAHPAG